MLGSKPGDSSSVSCGRVYGWHNGGLPFSLHYHDAARWLFVLLLFSGLLSTGWFGIPLIPRYFIGTVDIVSGIFALFSALGTIWGIMAYREFTKSAGAVIDARLAARRLDPTIGDYEYKSYNPMTREYEDGFVPSGPVDFWDKETTVPAWMDKGKYWHILLSLQSPGREIRLQVVRDRDLPFGSGMRNVAVTSRDQSEEGRIMNRYIVKIPQWLVMNTERGRFSGHEAEGPELSALIADVNRKIVAATNEVAGWERLRVRYPWRFMTFVIYLNKSLPLRIVYRQVIRNFPGAKERKIYETNANLANVGDDELVVSIMELAQKKKKIPPARMAQIQTLVRFLKNAYTRQGLGEGASEYHNFHHSLEVAYVAMQLLPDYFRGYEFGPKDYELLLVAGLLHDYDPAQELGSNSGKPKGPSAARTVQEVQRTRIHDAYFTMTNAEFEEYFRQYRSSPSSSLQPPEDYATTHPERVKSDWTPTESLIIETLIWRTDFPFFKQKLAQEKYSALLSQLKDNGKVNLLAEVLWLADLSVTYMVSDPVRAWDRVNNLYDELFLPKLEAVSRTDAFFADFADLPLYRELLAQRGFPDVFRRRWNLIYQFFHEGNPSTPLNRTIEMARKIYFKVNVELGMRRGEMLQEIASENWSEYFIGIGKDQSEVLKAKSRLAELDPQNASAFWGDVQKLLPSIPDGAIDNFLIVMPGRVETLATQEEKSRIETRLSVLVKKLAQGGAVKILTDIDGNSPQFLELMSAAGRAGLAPSDEGKQYFPAGWTDPDFAESPRVITLAPRPAEIATKA
ncbi:HD domain-containing protein [Nitrososphaera viennensis]|uniref:tRNA (guanine(46)-N(7))-methyltransferase n=1 Tax=Nitrososphaera viennensis TaxID=1034015 RepID=A0A977NL02_9ARCH|nr:HD domain-containing protein [Nitrososphaera viennensis]UVS67791.1 HD domain-containing protein [Nitrososphaera viennensis]